MRAIRWAFLLLIVLASSSSFAATETAKVHVNWDRVIRVSKTYPSLLCVGNPNYLPNSPIHNQVFSALKNLHADYVSYLGWYPYPKLAVAELKPPHDGKTYWDFSLLDSIMKNFFAATKGHPTMVDFGTIPEWMFKTPHPVAYPSDPSKVDWTYPQGTELRDPSGKELGEYYARLASWYTRGGFRDEYGKWHESGYHYKIDYWGVLNEIDIEHQTTPQQYNRRYDAIVSAVRKVLPHVKFVGMMLALPTQGPKYFEYFLNPKNHKPGIPIDMVGYHFYAIPAADETPAIHQYTFFDMADQFLAVVRYIEGIRERLSPHTRTIINELGVILPQDLSQGMPGFVWKPEYPGYRHQYAALYAYMFAELAKMGIDVAGESQLQGFPGQFPSVSMLDPKTGKPNATYWVLSMLIQHVRPGDKIVTSSVEMPSSAPFLPAYIETLAVVKPDRTREILLVNKRDRSFEVTIPGAANGKIVALKSDSGFNPPTTTDLHSDTFTLGPMEVAIVTLP